jgi:hypothetical protein
MTPPKFQNSHSTPPCASGDGTRALGGNYILRGRVKPASNSLVGCNVAQVSYRFRRAILIGRNDPHSIAVNCGPAFVRLALREQLSKTGPLSIDLGGRGDELTSVNVAFVGASSWASWARPFPRGRNCRRGSRTSRRSSPTLCVWSNWQQNPAPSGIASRKRSTGHPARSVGASAGRGTSGTARRTGSTAGKWTRFAPSSAGRIFDPLKPTTARTSNNYRRYARGFNRAIPISTKTTSRQSAGWSRNCKIPCGVDR